MKVVDIKSVCDPYNKPVFVPDETSFLEILNKSVRKLITEPVVISIESTEAEKIYSKALSKTKLLREELLDNGKSIYMSIVADETEAGVLFHESIAERNKIQNDLKSCGYHESKLGILKR